MKGLEAILRLPRDPGNDRYGDPLPPGPDDAPETFEGCTVWPGNATSGMEPFVPGREPLVTDLVVSLPPGAHVLSTDKLRIRGKVYDVVGEPFDWINRRTGKSRGVIAYANRGEG